MGPGRKEFTRADSDNWRTLREEQEEDEGEPGSNWRLAGPRRDGMLNTNIYRFIVVLPQTVLKEKAIHKKMQRPHVLFSLFKMQDGQATHLFF